MKFYEIGVTLSVRSRLSLSVTSDALLSSSKIRALYFREDAIAHEKLPERCWKIRCTPSFVIGRAEGWITFF